MSIKNVLTRDDLNQNLLFRITFKLLNYSYKSWKEINPEDKIYSTILSTIKTISDSDKYTLVFKDIALQELQRQYTINKKGDVPVSLGNIISVLSSLPITIEKVVELSQVLQDLEMELEFDKRYLTLSYDVGEEIEYVEGKILDKHKQLIMEILDGL